MRWKLGVVTGCGEFPPANAGESEGASASAHGVAGSAVRERDQRNVDFRDELLAGV